MSAAIDCPLGPIVVAPRTITVNLPPSVAALCTPSLDAYFAARDASELADLSRELDAHILEGKPLGPAWTGEGRSFPEDEDGCGECSLLRTENAALRRERDALVKAQNDWRNGR